MGRLSGTDGKRASKGGRSDGKAPRFNDNQFVRYELDANQQKELKAANVTADQIFDDLFALISDGYKFTVKWDTYSECFGVFMQSDGTEDTNAGFILTGRGSSPLKALKQVIYKHRVCLDGNWSDYVEREGRGVIDD